MSEAPRQIRLAYLTSRYPAISHTFVMREVRALRARGLDVETMSIRRAPPEGLLTDADRREAAATHVILPPRPADLAAAHLGALVRAPSRYLATLGRALRLGRGGPRATLWMLFYFAEAMLLWRHLRRRGIRHVHVHFANVAADVAMLTVRYADTPRDRWTWSFTMHGPTEFADQDAHRLRQKAGDALFVVCISDFCRSQLMALEGRDRWPGLHVVHCGVDPRWLGPLPDRAGHDPGRFRVLSVGRLVPVKGQAVLLEAVAALRRRGVPAELTLVGDGPDRAALERVAAGLGLDGVVRLAGAVGQDRMPGCYAEADAFCLTSFAEGVPVVLMEAMATGLPVVATRIAGISELVEDGVSGRLVPPGRADLVADALEGMAGDPAGRAAMGAAGRRAVEDGFQAERSAARLAGLFSAAVPRGGPR